MRGGCRRRARQAAIREAVGTLMRLGSCRMSCACTYRDLGTYARKATAPSQPPSPSNLPAVFIGRRLAAGAEKRARQALGALNIIVAALPQLFTAPPSQCESIQARVDSS